MFVTLDETRKNTPKTYVIANKDNFWNVFFSVDLLGPKEIFLSFAQSIPKHLLDLYVVFLVIFHVRWNEKKVAKSLLFTGYIALFSTTLCFQHPLVFKKRSFKIQSFCLNSLWTLIKCSLMFVTLDGTRKRGRKLFSTWKQFFSEMFVPIDPLDPEEIIWSFAQKMSVYLVYPYNMSDDFFLVR